MQKNISQIKETEAAEIAQEEKPEPASPSPEGHSDALPEEKPDASPEEKAEASPEEKPAVLPEEKADASPEDKTDALPEEKADAPPEEEADTSPEEKTEPAADAEIEENRKKQKEAGKRKSRRRTGKKGPLTRTRIKRQLKVALILFVLVFAITVASGYRHYKTFPGIVARDSIRTESKGLDYLELTWDEVRNADKYHIFYKEYDRERNAATEPVIDETWTEEITKTPGLRVENLQEGVKYAFILRADSEKYTGLPTRIRTFTTKQKQHIEIDGDLVKMTSSKPFNIGAEAETDLTYESSDPNVIEVDADTGKATVKGEGIADIKIRAKASDDFTSAKKTIEIRVYDAYPSDISGSSVRLISHLDPDNCEAWLYVSGEGSANVPQGMAYTGDRYMITFGMSGATRIISYDINGENRTVEIPGASLGHPNGFTYSPDTGRCYCVRGRSNKCVIYNTNDGSYRTINMPVGCSGIGYDRVRKWLTTSARKSLVVYNPDDLSIIRRTGVISHSGTVYRQDCDCYDGLMMVVVSGSGKHGINYIDLYDMEHAQYIGSFSTDLSEVESVIVDNDGFMEILANGSGNADIIWKTDINIAKLAEELK